jgi:hypothetical protein
VIAVIELLRVKCDLLDEISFTDNIDITPITEIKWKVSEINNWLDWTLIIAF